MTTQAVPDIEATAQTPAGFGGPVQPSHGRLSPLGISDITVTAGYWARMKALNAESIIPHCVEWIERSGWLSNFDKAAQGTLGTEHAGIEFVDSEVYKLLEALAWEIGSASEHPLLATYQSLVERVTAAQEPDGYVHTSFGRQGQPPRFSNLEWGHELYCHGHLLQAAVARLRGGHDDALPAMARRLADFLVAEFGPDGRDAVCGHPEIELGLVEFGRATSDARYIALAATFIERRGRGRLKPIEFGQQYFQDDTPVRDATVLRGHAVRALYLSASAIDVGVETSDEELTDSVERQYRATLARRTYITGALGSHHRDEALGDDFELPHDRAYAETCAAIASVMTAWRLLLRRGASEYGDVIERTLFNAVLASPRADGKAFFYSNTLHLRQPGTPTAGDHTSPRAQSTMRAPWFDVSCCPTNVARTIASAQLYFATTTSAGVQIHQFGTFHVRAMVESTPVNLTITSDYPYDGRVHVRFDATPDRPIELAVRIPEWADSTATWTVTSVSASARKQRGYLVVSGAFAQGDAVTLELGLAPRIVRADARVDDVRGQVAVERGPLVMAIESVDLPPGLSTENVELDLDSALVPTARGVDVTLTVRDDPDEPWPYGDATCPDATTRSRVGATLIPYATWANRGPSTMRVFIPVTPRN